MQKQTNKMVDLRKDVDLSSYLCEKLFVVNTPIWMTTELLNFFFLKPNSKLSENWLHLIFARNISSKNLPLMSAWNF